MGPLTFTGDRLLGLLALGVLAGLGLARRLRWTPVHSALALFVGAQGLTTLANAGAWPAGLKFVTIYALGFACFGLAAEWARRSPGRQALVTWWIALGAGLAVPAAVLAAWANLSQHPVWGAGMVQETHLAPPHPRWVFAGQATFVEPNLLSSFLVVPFALALWGWPARRPAAALSSLTALVLGLTFGFTRAVWIATAGAIAVWCWSARPPWRRLAALAAMLTLAVVLHAAVVGVAVLDRRLIHPIETGTDRNLRGRIEISTLTIDSWLARPLIGRGAGSLTRLSLLRPSGRRIPNVWNGNLVLFVLHDSGLVGLGALLWLGAVVWRQGIGALRARPDGLTPPLLAAGGALCFAFQFTHGLWLMYPYVYLGLLAGVTDEAARAPSRAGQAAGVSIPTSLGRISRIWPRSTASARRSMSVGSALTMTTRAPASLAIGTTPAIG